ncbi:hypothetical protein ACRN98_01250 [Shewanella oncorhynchi]|uniref:hypothetical protein n=1 Tax=Shewanella TaxID=22 RepID=UPI0021DB3266|nr:hypothetical protein [Shewanella sp. SM69]MCU8037228.1 hypothetical protein [Shewanella sp. SM69]
MLTGPTSPGNKNAHTTDIEAVICIGEAFYCNAAGHSQKQADIAQHNAKAEAFKQRLLSLRPALTFTAFNSTKEKSASSNLQSLKTLYASGTPCPANKSAAANNF